MTFEEEEGPGFGLAKAARLMSVGRAGKPVHVSTLVRWIQRGVGGVCLEAYRVGGRWMTTKGVLQRFAARLTERSSAAASPPARVGPRGPRVGAAGLLTVPRYARHCVGPR